MKEILMALVIWLLYLDEMEDASGKK